MTENKEGTEKRLGETQRGNLETLKTSEISSPKYPRRFFDFFAKDPRRFFEFFA